MASLRLDLAGGVARDARRRNWTADMLIFRWLPGSKMRDYLLPISATGPAASTAIEVLHPKYRQAASTWFGKGSVR
jgi:hypothetical protein